MQTLPILAGAALIACASSFAAVRLLVPDQPAAPPPTALEGRLAALQEQQQSLERAVRELGTRLQAQQAAPAARSAVPAVSDEQVRAAVAALLASGELGPLAAAEPDRPAPPEVDFDDALSRLTGGGLSRQETDALWTEIREAGMLDRMVEAFEARAKAQPGVPGVQVDLGNAYLRKLFDVPEGPARGRYALMADRAFSDALDIDPQHWDARFQKAVSLSFWPPAFGKGTEAIRHFETLVEQQEAAPRAKPGYAETYVFLGNLYDQRGESEKAREIWERGLRMHPGHTELQGKVAK